MNIMSFFDPARVAHNTRKYFAINVKPPFGVTYLIFMLQRKLLEIFKDDIYKVILMKYFLKSKKKTQSK